jgi:ubiquinone biosynthesis protein
MLTRRLGQLGRTLQHVQRFRAIVRVFLKYGYEDVALKLHLPRLLGLHGRQWREEHERIRHLSGGERLRHACEELGPTFVKMGQVLSTRPHLLPDPFIRELARLQDSVAPLPFEEIETILRAELKCPPEEIFQFIEREPLGSASIAQVHRARLVGGEEVVIKVQRPGIRRLIEVDLDIMRQIASLIENHMEGWRVHRPVAVVEEIAKTIEKEIDFTVEAGHIERFGFQFQREPKVFVPRVYREFTTRQVLTLDYVGGMKASRFEETAADPAERREVAGRIADLVMKQILVHGFFHADPHPGNIHVLPGRVVCFLDFGMMGFLDEQERQTFAGLLWGIARRNEGVVARALLRLAGAEDVPPSAGLEADVADFMHQHFYRPLGEIEFGRVMTQLLQVTTRHGLRIPADFFIMLKALGVMEGLVRRLHPGHDLIRQALPFIRRARLAPFRPRKFLEGAYEFGLDFATLARELPTELRRIVAQLKTGEARLIFRHDGLEPLLHSADQVSNRVAFAIVLAALIIGSSLIVLANMPPHWHGVPVIGLLGFVLAALMGFWLLISILRHGRM